MDGNTLRTLGLIILAFMGIGLLFAAALLAVTVHKIRQMHLSGDMGFVATLRAVPISLVIALDLLDFALDVFSAPISWLLLTKLRLQGLRTVTVIKDLIPFTEFVPALTLAWIAVRALNLRAEDPRVQWIDGTARDITDVRRLPPANR